MIQRMLLLALGLDVKPCRLVSSICKCTGARVLDVFVLVCSGCLHFLHVWKPLLYVHGWLWLDQGYTSPQAHVTVICPVAVTLLGWNARAGVLVLGGG
jgi:hypothetical protein